MIIDTYFQIVDRLLVAELKVKRFAEAENFSGNVIAKREAVVLSKAREIYDFECCVGLRKPAVKHNNRFHDHSKVEGENWAIPENMLGIEQKLKETHENYWELQTEINAIKILLQNNEEDHLLKKFVEIQRKIDLANQLRNALIEHGDILYSQLFSKQ